jgi:hypothetical protein
LQTFWLSVAHTTQIERIIPDEDLQDGVKQLFKDSYSKLADVFLHYAADNRGSINEAEETMTLNEFNVFCHDGKVANVITDFKCLLPSPH